MEDVVNLHAGWKLQFECDWPMAFLDSEGSQFGVVKLTAWSSCFDVFS